LIIAITMVLSNMSNSIDLESMLEKLSMNPEGQVEEFISNPKFVLFIMLAIAVVGPIIEELFKTIGVWLLKPRNISPREGWTAGLMSGAGFGLIEGYLFSMQAVLIPDISGWLYFVLGRVGGLLLHTFTGGIVGWGLAKSWREKRPQHAIWSYLIAFLMHGLWNFAAVAQALLFKELPDIAVYISLGILFIGMLVAYLSLSYKITRELPAENTLMASYLPQDSDDAGPSVWGA
jgi:RsiW-degrading membrane proteinase PrsW (M82 family)